jgi:hypothetical protein
MEEDAEAWTYPYVRDTYEYEPYNTPNSTSYDDYYPQVYDPEYIPSGRPYVPNTMRRTPRRHGWTSGMYREEEIEWRESKYGKKWSGGKLRVK